MMKTIVCAATLMFGSGAAWSQQQNAEFSPVFEAFEMQTQQVQGALSSGSLGEAKAWAGASFSGGAQPVQKDAVAAGRPIAASIARLTTQNSPFLSKADARASSADEQTSRSSNHYRHPSLTSSLIVGAIAGGLGSPQSADSKRHWIRGPLVGGLLDGGPGLVGGLAGAGFANDHKQGILYGAATSLAINLLIRTIH